MADIVGITNSVPYAGIPAATVLWGTPGNQATGSATAYTATVFHTFNKQPGAELTITKDNSNEVLAIRRSNKTWDVSFAALIVGVTPGAALTVLQQSVPLVGDVVNISTGDTQINGYAYVMEPPKLSYTPDNNAVIDFNVRKFPVTLYAV